MGGAVRGDELGDRAQSAIAKSAETPSFLISPPLISLPKGGGGIRGIGEKFGANPVTGTGSMTVPIATSPGRSGFGQQLSLSYDSGAGNGPFGLGWSLSLPSITRKTDKGLPQYREVDEPDAFILSGAEDLVPIYRKVRLPPDQQEQWVKDPSGDFVIHDDPRTVETKSYRVRRYQPRIEGLFARIERWTNKADASDSFWRSISKDNVTTWYGRTEESRIYDPTDATRIFSWLICESYDDKGNVVAYGYKPEDSENIDVTRANERNRNREPAKRTANRYVKHIRYGNHAPYYPKLLEREAWPAPPSDQWYFEVVFDYGEHEESTPLPDDDKRVRWKSRNDPFSLYRSRFEVRTYRLCQRVLMFHHFDGVRGVGLNCLVRSTDFTYSYERDPLDVRNPIYSFLRSVSQNGYRRDGGGYARRSLPPLEFAYTEPTVDETIHDVDPESLVNLPYGLDSGHYQWIDLDGEGLSGILTEQAEGWFYKRNLSPLSFVEDAQGMERARAAFASAELVASRPNAQIAEGEAQFMDLAGDGQTDLVVLDGPTPGFYEHDEGASWNTFRAFVARLNRSTRDPNLRFVDLDGDGHADVLITEDEAFSWHASLAEEGFGPAQRVARPRDEEDGPALVFADGTQSIYLADMSGDGLTDLVRIRNGEVCYWPNLGYGRFGAKVTTDNAPWFDAPDVFDHRRLRVADIDGSGTTDLIYLHQDGARLYFNQSGNGWSQPHTLGAFPRVDNVSAVTAVDLLGNGTACLVWSSALPGESRRPMRYIDLMGGQKPHLLIETRNNLGATTEVRYASSTKFYLQDKAAGKPWVTRLPFPVHVVERTSVTDRWRGTTFATTYSYHHGYFDGIEREFRGFGRVEQVDAERYGKFQAGNAASPYVTDDKRLYQPPVKTVTWFHTGAFLDRERILSHFAHEYFPDGLEGLKLDPNDDFRENDLPEPDLEAQDLSADEWREALRACKGMPLRQEIYELDVDALEKGEHKPVKLFSTAYHNCHIRRLQPRGGNRHAVLLVTESEAVTYHYELDLTADQPAPDPRIAHTLNLNVDAFGRVLQSVAVAYPRFLPFDDDALDPSAVDLVRSVQGERHIAYTEARYTDEDIDEPDRRRLRLPCETQTYELTGFDRESAGDRLTPDPRDNLYFSIDELRAYRLSERYQTAGTPVGLLQYHQQPPPALPGQPKEHKRLVELVRTLYFDDASDTTAPTKPLDFGKHGPRGLKYEDYKLALTDDLLNGVFQTRNAAGAVVEDKLSAPVEGAVTARDLLADPRRSGYVPGTTIDPSFSGQYWMRSGIAGFENDAPDHFFLPRDYTDPFENVTTISFDSRDLYVESSKDARDNEARIVDFDFRVLAPRAMQDINGNVTRAAFDILGMPVAVALERGGDTVAGLNAGLLDPPFADVIRFFELDPYDDALPRRWLDQATTRFVYHLGEVLDANGNVIDWEARPAAACTVQRETHVSRLGGAETKIQVAVEYSDGGGNVLVKKAQAEPDSGSTLRWIASGKTILNNKGKPVKQYEPYFSGNDYRFDRDEAESEVGVTPVMYYDAPGRLVRTEMPDGTFSRVEFSPWHVKTYDANDTVLDSQWFEDRGRPGAASAEPADPDERAAWLAAAHSDTPSQTHLDSLARDVVAIAHNRVEDPGARVVFAGRHWRDERYLTFTKLDAEGKPLWIRDARGNLIMQYIRRPKANNDPSNDIQANTVPCYDIAGNPLFQHSMDAGERWTINDAAGKQMVAWDANDRGPGSPMQQRTFFTEYDELHRPTKHWLTIDDDDAALIEALEYCDTNQPNGAATLADAQQRNLIGQAVEHWDPSGLVTVQRIDLCGKPSYITRTLVEPDADGGTGVIDWDVADRGGLLDGETFLQMTEYDALSRITTLYNWHRDITFATDGTQQPTPGSTNRVAVYQPQYNERGALASEWVYVRASKTTDTNGAVSFTQDAARSRQAIRHIAYNEKGQKLSLELGNAAVARYSYDPKTFRLVHLFTQRDSAVFRDDCTSNTADDPRPRRPCGVQNLHYSYDPVGNITHIQDDAQQTVYFSNSRIEPSNDYTYDALYRLIEATGRENAPALVLVPPRNREDPWPNTGFPSADSLRSYTQRYSYDAVGNFLEMVHAPAVGSGWTRHYTTKSDSNRLDQTWYGADTVHAVTYRHDIHGNMLNLNRTATPPPLDPEEQWGLDIGWDWRDMIMGFDLGGGGLARYYYGIDKQRTRKHITRNGAGIEEDRIYLGGYELYRRRNPRGAVVEEIESHHLFEGEQRVVLVDDVIVSSKGSPDPRPDGLSVKGQTLFRYQYSNHLGSVSLELDGEAKVISYEEYHPYGTCAYRSMRSGIEAPPKKYRYTGMQRDEESGLEYHRRRYYAPTVVRWLSVDSAGIVDGTNLYSFVRGNPIVFRDATGFAAKTNPTAVGPLDPDPLPKTSADYPKGVPRKKVSSDEWNTARKAHTERSRAQKGTKSEGGKWQEHHTLDVDAAKAAHVDPDVAGEPERLLTAASRRTGMRTATLSGKEVTHHSVLAKTGKEIQARTAASPEGLVDASAETAWKFRGTGINRSESIPIETDQSSGQATKWGAAEENPMPRPIVQSERAPFNSSNAMASPGLKAAVEANEIQSAKLGLESWPEEFAPASEPPGAAGKSSVKTNAAEGQIATMVLSAGWSYARGSAREKAAEVMKKPIGELTDMEVMGMSAIGWWPEKDSASPTGATWHRTAEGVIEDAAFYLWNVFLRATDTVTPVIQSFEQERLRGGSA